MKLKRTEPFYHYEFGGDDETEGFLQVIGNHPLTEKEIVRLEKEAEDIINGGTEAISDEINKRILERILNKKK
jgi:hypothetical protein